MIYQELLYTISHWSCLYINLQQTCHILRWILYSLSFSLPLSLSLSVSFSLTRISHEYFEFPTCTKLNFPSNFSSRNSLANIQIIDLLNCAQQNKSLLFIIILTGSSKFMNAERQPYMNVNIIYGDEINNTFIFHLLRWIC